MSGRLHQFLPIGSRIASRFVQPGALQGSLMHSVLQEQMRTFAFSSLNMKQTTCLLSLSQYLSHTNSPLVRLHLAFAFQPVRYYRIKRNTERTTEQELVRKVCKITSTDVKTLDEYCVRLRHLVSRGCKAYQLVECPGILKHTESEIDRRVERLKLLCGQTKISISLLNIVKSEKSDNLVTSSIQRYLKQQNGHLSKVEEIKIALRCTDDEMTEVLMRNPRLVGSKKRKFIVEKVKCLLECGALLDDIKCNTSLLVNKTLEDIESRAKHLASLGYTDPLPMGVIGRDEKDYTQIAERLARERSIQPVRRYLESKDIIAKMPEYADKKLYVVKPKVDYLLSKGYMGDDIIACPLLLELSLATIQDAVNYLEQYYLGRVSLENCHSYATVKRVSTRSKSVRKAFAKVLQCTIKDLPDLPKDLSISFNKEETLKKNLEFLTGLGFTVDEIKSLPILLAHNSDALQRHWGMIQSDDELFPYFEKWKDDNERLLNLLQYSMEKESSFLYAAFTDIGDEQRSHESNGLDYETQEFVPSDPIAGDCNDTKPDLEDSKREQTRLSSQLESDDESGDESSDEDSSAEDKLKADADCTVPLESNMIFGQIFENNANELCSK